MLAATGLVLAPEGTVSASSSATTLPSTATAMWRIDAHETMFGPAAVIPETLTIRGNEVVLGFEIVSLAPYEDGFRLEDSDVGGVGLETLTLITQDAEYPGRVASPSAREARFAVAEGFDLATVRGIRVDQYRLRVPYTYDIELEPADGDSIEVEEGRILTVANVIAQSNSVIIHLDDTHPADAYGASQAPTFQVTGIGPEWLTAASRQFGAGYALTREGPDIPDPLRLRVHSIEWVAFPASVMLDLGGVRVG